MQPMNLRKELGPPSIFGLLTPALPSFHYTLYPIIHCHWLEGEYTIQNIAAMVLKAIKYHRGELEILDQLKLPHQEIYEKISTPEEAWHAIKAMKVRGAPAIAIVAALSLAVWGATYIDNVTENVIPRLEIPIPQYLSERLKYLVTSRPTAVNLAEAVARLDALIWETWNQVDATGVKVIEAYVNAAEQMLVDDVNDNENIGKYGAEWLLRKANSKSKISVLTHCNTGYTAVVF